MGARDARIRDEAYRLWVAAGRPEGDEQRHWFEAERQVEASDAVVEKALKDKEVAKPSSSAAQTDMPDTGAAKAVSAGHARVAGKPGSRTRKDEVEGASAVPAPGPAGAKRAGKPGAKDGKKTPGGSPGRSKTS